MLHPDVAGKSAEAGGGGGGGGGGCFRIPRLLNDSISDRLLTQGSRRRVHVGKLASMHTMSAASCSCSLLESLVSV